MDDFEKELKMGFLDEAQQLLIDTEQCFLSLEGQQDQTETLNKIFRLAHNLKGSANAVGLHHMGEFAHKFESLLLKLKNNEIAVEQKIISVMLKCNDHLNLMTRTYKLDLDALIDSTELLNEIGAILDGKINQTAEVEVKNPDLEFKESKENLSEEAIQGLVSNFEKRIDDSELSKASQADKVIEITKKVAQQQSSVPTSSVTVSSQSPNHSGQQVQNIAKGKDAASGATDETIRVSLLRLEKLINFVGELVILQTVLKEQSNRLDTPLLKKTVHQLGKVTKEVQEISMGLRMLPIKPIYQKIQRIVRDTSQSLSKKINLQTFGEETELDKTVLESINDPIVHLVRNAIDHGVESPEERIKANKSEIGTVKIAAYHQNGKLVIEINDDGKGLDPKFIRKKAIEKGMITESTNLTDKECLELIFLPGFSTKSEVSDISGRGVGMDVVKTNIERLQGSITIDSVIGEGTQFKLFLPLTMAIIDGMVVQCAESKFIIPLSHILESYSPRPDEIKLCTGIGEMLLLRGKNIPLYRLNNLLGLKKIKKESEGIAIVINTAKSLFAIYVDEIICQQEIVIKKLGDELQDFKGISGSAILGDGLPAIILEAADLIQRNNSYSSLGKLAV